MKAAKSLTVVDLSIRVSEIRVEIVKVIPMSVITIAALP